MSCLTQHKTKEELSNWLMENASDNETTGFLDMLAGDIWSMMENTEVSRDDGWYLARLIEKETIKLKKEIAETTKELKKEHIQNIMKTKSIATELYREVKYSLGYGEFDEPDRKVMYDDIKKLKEENKKLNQEIEGWKNVYVDYAAGSAKKLTFENFREYLDAGFEMTELEEEKSGREHDVQQFQSVLEEKGRLEAEVEELKEEKSVLCKFLGGNYNESSGVEDILKEFFTPEFIEANRSSGAWDNIGLFEEEQ
jgi:hypothetical protein